MRFWKAILHLIFIASMLMTACGLNEATPPPVVTLTEPIQPQVSTTPAPAPTRLPLPDLSSLSIVELADKISTGNLIEATFAIQEALARSGMTISDLETTYLPARAPAGTMIATPEETLFLALQVQNEGNMGGLSGDEFGQMLSDFGWPYSPGQTPGEAMIQFFGAWIRAARHVPEDPYNFAPLMLDELSRRKTPPVDLGAGEALPGSVRFSFLELTLISAAFEQGIIVKTSGGAGKSPGLARPVIQAEEPCTYLKKLVPWPSVAQFIDVYLSEGTGKSLEIGLREIGISPDGVEAFGHALSALGIITRIWKTILYYSKGQVQVEGMPSSVHKPSSQENPEDKLIVFIARAGVNAEDWGEYKKRFGSDENDQSLYTADRAVRDCLSAYGLPSFADLADVAKDAENWRVLWEVRQGEEHTTWNLDQNSDFLVDGKAVTQPKMQRESDTSALTTYVREPKVESVKDHTGFETEAQLEVCAEVKNSPVPSLGTLINAAKRGLGLVDAIVELGAGWMQTMLRKGRCATVTIEYHTPYRFTIEGGVLQETHAYETGHEAYYEKGRVTADFSITAGADESQIIAGTGAGAVQLDTESTWPTEPFTGLADSSNEIGICTHSASGKLDWQVKGRVNSEDQTLEIEIFTPGGIFEGCAVMYPSPQEYRGVYVAGTFKLPLESNTYHIIILEASAKEQEITCGGMNSCAITATWDFTLTMEE